MKKFTILILAAVFLLTAETLFQVKDSQDRVVLDVSSDGLRVYHEGDTLMVISSSHIRAFIDKNPTKGLARSFSVTTSSSSKGETNVLEISKDATQMREGDQGDRYSNINPRNVFLGLKAGDNTFPWTQEPTFYGSLNTFIGNYAGYNNVHGYGNVYLGYRAGYSSTASNQNIYIGYEAGYDFGGENNTIVGFYAGRGSGGQHGNYNSLFGRASGFSLNNATFNTLIGGRSGSALTNGSGNTLIGYLAGSGKGDASFNNNTVLGSYAGTNFTQGSNNVLLGYDAGSKIESGSGNVFLGYQAGYNETGSNKLYIANSDTSTPLIYGDFSTGNIGFGTNNPGNNRLRVESSGSGLSNSTGWFYNSNTAGVALTAMANTTDAVLYASQTNTSSKTARIVSFGSSYGGTWTEKLYVLNMGNLYTPNLGTGTGTNLVVTTGGEVVRQTSSKRYKKDIENLNFDTSKFMKLQPVSFKWNEKSSSENIEDYGLIAEEVEKIDPQLAIYDGEGEVEGVDYQKINIMLLKVVQEQQKIISDQEDRIAKLEGMMEKMLKINENL